MQDEPDNAINLTTRGEWRAWLEQHHTRTQSVWLISFKKGMGKLRVAYEETASHRMTSGLSMPSGASVAASAPAWRSTPSATRT